jgi:hypothetical protein
MLGQFWRGVRVRAERLRQYRSAVVTAEALVWHHGYKGLDAALSAAESPTDDLRANVRAELVARLAADRYMEFKHGDIVRRAELLECWSRRRGQMIRV